MQVFLGAENGDRVRQLLRSGSITLPGQDEDAIEGGYLERIGESLKRGWAVNFGGETSIEEVGVASPVYDHRGDIVASVLIPAPKFRVSQDTLDSSVKPVPQPRPK